MSIINFKEARVLKTLKKERVINNKNKVKFHDIPSELVEIGVDSLMTTDGRELSEEDMKSLKEFAQKYRNGEIKF